MFSELLIRNLGVIEEVALDLTPGLNVLTGETGAGKTMVVSAIELLLGARADSERVRAGAATAVVEARLLPVPPTATEWVEHGDDELVVAREVGASRSRARLGGRLAPASALATALGSVVEVHGQSESSRLSTPAVQRALLDRAGGPGLASVKGGYDDAYRQWNDAREELAALHASEREAAREADRLRFELDEIDAVGPEPGEDQTLEATLLRLEHGEALTGAAVSAAAAVAEDGGARDGLGAAVAALRAVSGLDDRLDELAARVEALAVEAQDVALELRGYAESSEPDPARLAELRARRAALNRLVRKYGPDTAAVADYAAEARRRLAVLEGAEERATALQADVARLEERCRSAAAQLTEARARAGQRLAAAVAGHLAELAMPDARLEVRLEPTGLGSHGADQVEFLLAAHPGEPALGLAKAASGGERSRVALSVRLALSDAEAEARRSTASARSPAVFVFDEVDAGIGGQVARAVGEKLARLARGRQVLCVTHLAQLAAYADAHFLVSKADRDGRAVASVRRLDEDSGVAELARMLSGDPDSVVAAEHAAELRATARAAVG